MHSNKKIDNKTKILILQFRTDQSVSHEQDCFKEELDRSGLELKFVNIVRDQVDLSLLADVDGVILGGAGEFYLSRGHGERSWKQDSLNFLNYLIGADIPSLGICLGAQLIGLHQGGRITPEKKYHETGSFEIQLTEESSDCDIFSKLEDNFEATLAHQDTIVDLPDSDIVHLASSEKVKYQAFKIEGKPIWGTLFHPELNLQRLRFRLELYPSYADNIDKIMENFQDTSLCGRVLHEFVEVTRT